MKVAFVVEYNGGRYHGFEWQRNGSTIQAELEKAIAKVTGEHRRVLAASRTDAGVHAAGQVVSLWTESALSPDALLRAINAYLPNDIAIRAAFRVRDDFSVRSEAVSRAYEYTILNRRTRSALLAGSSYLVTGSLQVARMNEGCRLLEGRHDFLSFATQWEEDRNPVRTVFSAGFEQAGDIVTFHIVGDSFLPHQVRNTVGLLTRLGLGKIDLEEVIQIMEAVRPGLAGPTAPAQGLCLMRVNYAKPLGE